MTSRPISPAEHPKRHPPPVRPNAHPYAIKTTSSALLSRSNSSPHSAHHARHHYIPLSHSLIPPGTRTRHRHSSSLSSVEGEAHTVRTNPVSLPTSPPIVAAASDSSSVSLRCADEPEPTHQVWRAGTLSSGSATKPITGHDSDDRKHFDSCDRDYEPVQALRAVLSPNPKQWSTDELVTYLTTSLTSSNNTDGAANLMGILACVRACSLTGRDLLRLTDADLVSTPLTEVQRALLLQCSRTLRADVLRGRIHVDSHHSRGISDDLNDIYSRSAHSSTPFHSIRGASVSVDNLDLLLDNNAVEGEYVFPPSPTISLHRSNSVSDTSAERYRDLARMRTRRRGKVKGLVETWERASTSGSECSTGEEESASGSEVDSESETDPELYSMPNTENSSGSPSELSSADDDAVIMADSAAVLEESSAPPPPYTHVSTAHDVAGDREPSIEELLASSPSVPLTGARAWEADFGLGETVKRIPACASADVGDTSVSVIEPDTPRRPKDEGEQTGGGSIRAKRSSGRRSTGSKQKNAKTQKRVVTAIFTGSPADNLSENPSDVIPSTDQGSRKSDAHDNVRGNGLGDPDLQSHSDSALRALEESIAATRTQMDALRLRLEAVEADTSRQEAMLMRDQPHDSRRIPPSEIRQRRLKASEQGAARTVEPSRDEMPVENVRNRDVLEGWEIVSLADIARAMVARAIGWVFPYGHLGAHAHEDHDGLHARTGFRPQEDKKRSSPAPVKGNGRLSLARASCSIILVSFALCATVLRRIGFGRWFRGS